MLFILYSCSEPMRRIGGPSSQPCKWYHRRDADYCQLSLNFPSLPQPVFVHFLSNRGSGPSAFGRASSQQTFWSFPLLVPAGETPTHKSDSSSKRLRPLPLLVLLADRACRATPPNSGTWVEGPFQESISNPTWGEGTHPYSHLILRRITFSSLIHPPLTACPSAPLYYNQPYPTETSYCDTTILIHHDALLIDP